MMSKFLYVLLFPILVFGQTSFEQAEILFEKKQFSGAEKLLVGFIASNPNDLTAIELLGDTYSKQKKWDAATKQYNKLVEANNQNANYHYKFGGALGMKALENKLKSVTYIGDIKSSFLKAAELDPSHIGTRWALVELYMELPGIFGGSKNKALKFANELEALSKVDGYLAKGFIYEYDDEPELAEKFYKMAVKEGGSLVCYEKLTKFYLSQNQPKKAVSNLNEAYKKHQDENLLIQIKEIKEELY
ncbi:tetratricopeptide repeat protein [Flavisericum labens]|uniref:tetratricopeptide repeat protein n=1 Tax=Flavisericum labens TaxID=3377112 RepID=UPI00387ADC14